MKSVRILDSYSARWRTASVEMGEIVGDDFEIDRSAVLFIELLNPISAWSPEGAL